MPDKTKILIEDRWARRHGNCDGSSLDSNCSSVKKRSESPRVAPIRLLTPSSRSSTPLTSFPSSRKGSITGHKSSMQKQNSLPRRNSRSEAGGKHDSARKNIANLPIFKLKLEDSCSESNKSLQLTPSGPYRFSYTSDSARKCDKVDPEASQYPNYAKDGSTPISLRKDSSSSDNQSYAKEEFTPISLRKNSFSTDTPNSNSSPNQTAANLRARLQLIREKRVSTSNLESNSTSVPSNKDEKRFKESNKRIQSHLAPSLDLRRWDGICDILNSLLCLATPLPDDNHPILVQSCDCFQKIHSSITQTETDSSTEELRSDTLSKTSLGEFMGKQ